MAARVGKSPSRMENCFLLLSPIAHAQQLYPVDGVTPAPKPVALLMPVCTVVLGSER